jgi:ABC-type xylose transport system permease subunit
MANFSFDVWLPKAFGASIVIGILLWWTGTQVVTISEIATSISSIPFAVILLIEALDKFADVSGIYNKLIPQNTANHLLKSVVIGVIAFVAVLYGILGTISLSLGSIAAPALVAAGICAVYILAPETGDDELLLFAWLGATFATLGANISLIPSIPGITG